MDTSPNDLASISARLKELLVSELSLDDVRPEDIGDDEPLFVEGLGLDSLDSVEIVVLLQRHFGVELNDRQKAQEVMQSIGTLARFVRDNMPPAAK